MDRFRVAISTGHGKKRLANSQVIDDPGAINPSLILSEYDVCVKYRHILLNLLEWDRRFDIFPVPLAVPLYDRTRTINCKHSEDPFDLAIELHMNSFSNPDADYTEVLHYAKKVGGETVSSVMGKKYGDVFLLPMMEELSAKDMKNDGLSEPFGDEDWEKAHYGFVKGCQPPALVIESAFISNTKRVEQIKTGELFSMMAMGCYKGLISCLGV